MMIEMRDDARLSTDLYMPDGVGPFPVILIRTPYDKKMLRPGAVDPSGKPVSQIPQFFASHGYVVVVQDMRGRWESEGRFTIDLNERADFEDTVNWLDKQTWSTRRVGTWGCSYLGETQIIQAATRHPSLKAIVPQSAAGGFGSAGHRYRYFAALNGGAFELAMGLGWFAEDGSAIFLKPPRWVSAEEWERVSPLFTLGPAQPRGFNFARDVTGLPLVGLLDRLGFVPTDWNDFVSNPPGSEYWNKRDYVREGETINVPALHVNSWYDYGVGDTIHQFQYFQKHADSATAAQNQFLIIGAGLHCTNEWVTESTVVGERDVGDPRFDHWSVYLAWFNRWLRDDATALRGVPRVHYYLLGKNEWRSADSMPVSGTHDQNFFLMSRQGANSLEGDGELGIKPPRMSGHDEYSYDPESPVPSLGGPICCTGSFDQPEGSYDQRKIEARRDVLVYSTPRLAAGLTVVGPVKVVLYVSSTVTDTDFTAKLIDVYPDGRAFYLVEGIQRARYRDNPERQVFMEPGKVYPLEIDLQAIGNWFGPGHRIRLEVSSSSFPRWDRNMNTGGHNYDETSGLIARNTLHLGPVTPSHLVLPIVRP
jgi:putative CocE/NonD family hydrolase